MNYQSKITRDYQLGGYYHIYNRGAHQLAIFRDELDKHYFIGLLRRYLSPNQVKDKSRKIYKNFNKDITLHCFALMDNHFHILLEQKSEDDKAISAYMKCVMNAYSYYFNKKYKHSGTFIQGTYKAIQINSDVTKDIDNYLCYLTKYIHKNPKDYTHSQFTSLPKWTDKIKADWISDELLYLYKGSIKAYQEYLEQNDKHPPEIIL